MNKNFFLILISVLFVIPTVLALSPGDVFNNIIGFLSGDLGVNDPQFIAYARLAFALIIGFLLYEVLSHVNVPQRASVAISAFIALIAIIFAPKQLLIEAATTYNVVIWSLLLGVPILAVSFLVYKIPGSSIPYRIAKITLLALITFLVSFAAKGFVSAYGNLFSPENNASQLASWVFLILILAMIYQLVQLIRQIWGHSKGNSETSSTNTTTTQPTGPTSTQSQGLPTSQLQQAAQAGFHGAQQQLTDMWASNVEDQRKKKKKQKKQKDKWKKRYKQSQKDSVKKLEKLTEQVKEISEKYEALKNQEQTPEVVQDLKDGEAVLNENKKEIHQTLQTVYSGFKEKEQQLMQEIQEIEAKLARIVGYLKKPNLKQDDSSILTTIYSSLKKLIQQKNQELQRLKEAEAASAQQAQRLQHNLLPDPNAIKTTYTRVEEAEKSNEELEEETDKVEENIVALLPQNVETSKGNTNLQQWIEYIMASTNEPDLKGRMQMAYKGIGKLFSEQDYAEIQKVAAEKQDQLKKKRNLTDSSKNSSEIIQNLTKDPLYLHFCYGKGNLKGIRDFDFAIDDWQEYGPIGNGENNLNLLNSSKNREEICIRSKGPTHKGFWKELIELGLYNAIVTQRKIKDSFVFNLIYADNARDPRVYFMNYALIIPPSKINETVPIIQSNLNILIEVYRIIFPGFDHSEGMLKITEY